MNLENDVDTNRELGIEREISLLRDQQIERHEIL